jgi:hypothetical protein
MTGTASDPTAQMASDATPPRPGGRAALVLVAARIALERRGAPAGERLNTLRRASRDAGDSCLEIEALAPLPTPARRT